ncbi:UDP-glycosyltransferase UGT5 isoform X1 [Nilaparvata lugens]|uniref:UDP-glycosyltransferase UGT5 isoform X1 n=1 Tax=Nilaparvata lugens TaxID=108931 RepID=UPI00193E6663|nr:UDP-glycosyltransferase UGT5 isoform X1 [Nilaparvata lugens]
MELLLVLLKLLFCLAVSSDAANILAIVPFKGRSHFIVIQPLLEGLAERGHNVTVVSTYPREDSIQNYHDIDLSDEMGPSELNRLAIDDINSKYRSPLKGMHWIWELCESMCHIAYNSSKVQNLIKSQQKYDLLITEIFASDCYIPFAHKLRVPLVSISTFYPTPWLNPRISNPDNPSYITHYALPYTDKMTFTQRLLNTLAVVYGRVGYHLLSDSASYDMGRTYFGSDLPSISDISKETSLILVNNHHSISQVRPLVPNLIEIGGIHLRPPRPLPKDLQNELDKSEKGIIIFSFGSVVRASSLPASIVDDFIKAFARIDLTVLWKFEGTVGNLPPNVIVRKWIPQIDVIAHPNVKLLITHGGLASIIEAVSHGVPIIGIPMFGDQPSNIQRIVGKGAGLKIDYSEINAETVYNTIQQILLNPTYKSNAEKLSRVFNDREMPPLETAVYWIEYVLRHKGAHHLRSGAQNLSWIELYCLDILAFLIFGTTTFFIVSIKLIRILVKFIIK